MRLGLAQPYSGTARDAPPVAVSRVGCCELSLAYSSVTAKSSRSLIHRFNADQRAPLLRRWIFALISKLLSTPTASRLLPRSRRSLPRSYGADPPAPSICSCRFGSSCLTVHSCSSPSRSTRPFVSRRWIRLAKLSPPGLYANRKTFPDRRALEHTRRRGTRLANSSTISLCSPRRKRCG